MRSLRIDLREASMNPSRSDFHVREGTAGDYQRLYPVFDEAEAFHRRALPQVFQKPPERFPSRSLYEDVVTESGSMVFVAERKSQLVGFLVIRVTEAPDEPVLTKRRFAMVDIVACRLTTNIWALATSIP
jgi:hypothetical protein